MLELDADRPLEKSPVSVEAELVEYVWFINYLTVTPLHLTMHLHGKMVTRMHNAR
jgi:hypothetical protein